MTTKMADEQEENPVTEDGVQEQIDNKEEEAEKEEAPVVSEDAVADQVDEAAPAADSEAVAEDQADKDEPKPEADTEDRGAAAEGGEASGEEVKGDMFEQLELKDVNPSAQTEEEDSTDEQDEAANEACSSNAEKPEEEGEGGGEKSEEREGGGEKSEEREGEGGGGEKSEERGEEEGEEVEQAAAAEPGEGEAVQETTEEEQAPGAEHEMEEEPVVGEKLSREGTPETAASVQHVPEQLDTRTPEQLGEELADEEEGAREELGDEEEGNEKVQGEEQAVMVEEEPEGQTKRDELMERYQEALAQREHFQLENNLLQNKLAEYFKKKKTDDRQDYDKTVTDQEQRYLKYMAQLEDLKRQESMNEEKYAIQIEEAKEKAQEKKERVDAERKKFLQYKKQVTLSAINSRSGKPIPPKDIEEYIMNEVKKEQEVVNVRLENIKLKYKLKKKEQHLKSKEELAEGLHLIDFEQLKIENQTYNEKIEERNEELLKLRKKITSTVQILTHVKEKLQFVQGENSEQANNLQEVEASLAQSRDILSRTKQARDALRIDNEKLRQSSGLLGNVPLLRDYEERKEETDELQVKLEQLHMKHAELVLTCHQVRRKIEASRQVLG